MMQVLARSSGHASSSTGESNVLHMSLIKSIDGILAAIMYQSKAYFYKTKLPVMMQNRFMSIEVCGVNHLFIQFI